MPVEPVFNSDMETLKRALRLGGADTSSSMALIEAAVQESRAGIYGRVDAARVASIQAIALEENPTTSNGLLRVKAATLEQKWVRMLLMRTMPSLFVDAAAPQQVWNQEGFTRELGSRVISQEIDRLTADIERLLAELGESASGSVQAFCVEPAVNPPPLGARIYTGGYFGC